MKSNTIEATRALLAEHGYRVTEGRVELLTLLRNSLEPLTASEIHLRMNHSIDKATLYRALEDFVVSKIVAKVNLQDGVAYYELLHLDHHHHHIVCENCGKIEDIESCDQVSLQKKVLRSSKHFKIVNSHSLEFFGLCHACCKK